MYGIRCKNPAGRKMNSDSVKRNSGKYETEFRQCETVSGQSGAVSEQYYTEINGGVATVIKA